MTFHDVLFYASRATGKVKRSLLRAPVIRHWSDDRYYAAVGRHAELLPSLQPALYETASSLRATAIAVSPANVLPPEILRLAQPFLEQLVADTSTRSCVVVEPEQLARVPELCTWGLQDDLLDLVESYFGLPIQYLGLAIKRECADALVTDVRQWHLDVEDRKMIKVIVYLNDVDDDGGPFQYLARRDTERAKRLLGYSSGFVRDTRMAQIVESSSWRRVTGPAGTTVLVDTCRLFHRIEAPRKRDRYSLTFSYASKYAIQRYYDSLRFRRVLHSFRDRLNPRQRLAI